MNDSGRRANGDGPAAGATDRHDEETCARPRTWRGDQRNPFAFSPPSARGVGVRAPISPLALRERGWGEGPAGTLKG